MPTYSPLGNATCFKAVPVRPLTASCWSQISADIDGDRRPDTIMLVGRRTADDRFFEPEWVAEIDLSSNGRYESVIEAPFKPSFPLELLAAADVNGDGRDELFVHLDHGASVQTWLMLVWNGQDLVPAWRDGQLAVLRVSGSVTHGDGFECRATVGGRPIITMLAAVLSRDGGGFSWTEEDLALSGKVLQLVGSRSGTATLTEVQDPAGRFFWYWGAHCAPSFGRR